MNTNIHHLTRAHTAIAAKKRARQAQVKEVVFDDDARREFLTGFHKRKLAKANVARQKAKLREKEERLEIRRDQRRNLREKALENAAHVEKAYGATADTDLENASDDEEGTEEWTGIQVPEEYEDEETLATVTIVEDFDPDTIIHGPVKAERDNDAYPPASSSTTTTANQKSSSSSATAKIPSSTPKSSTKKPSKPRERKVRYETKDARRREQTKQHKRRTEKAELAGGKASRKPAGRGGRGRGGKR